jgi:hypothetical protein
MYADFRGLKFTHKCTRVFDGITNSRKPHCEVFFCCLWLLRRAITQLP